MMKKSALIVLIVTIVVFLASSISSVILLVNYGVDSYENYTETFTSVEVQEVELDDSDSAVLKNQTEIELKDIICEITVKKSKNNRVSAKLSGSFSGAGMDAPEIVMKTDSETIEISMKKDFSFKSLFNGISMLDSSVVLEVYIPESFAGEFSMEDCACAANIEGDFDKLSISDCLGQIEATGAYKFVEISDCAQDVTLQITEDFDCAEFDDCFGRIDLTIPDDTKGTITAKKCVGDVDSDFEINRDSEEIFDYSGEMNGGGASKLVFNNCVGEIRINSAA